MGTARVYRLRRRPISNNFSPATYKSACGLIEGVKTYPAIELNVLVSKGDNTIHSTLYEVLTYNNLKPKKYTLKDKKIKYYFENRKKMEAAANLISKMKNDSISLADINFDFDPPIGISQNGVDVPLSGYSRKQQNDNDEGYDQHEQLKSDKETASETTEEKSSPNWYLIGGAVLIGVIVILAVVKLVKK